MTAESKRKIVVVGSGGRLGAALVKAWREEFEVTGITHADLDLSDLESVERHLAALPFDVLINCAAMTNVDLCEQKRQAAFRINADAPEMLAKISHRKGARFIHFSTDYVFDGEKRTPYTEEDAAEPISVYGESKREGEEKVLAMNERNLVVRVSWVFGPERPSFIDNMIQRARTEPDLAAVADKWSTPTYTRDVASIIPHFFPAEVGGVLHLSNEGQCTWREYAHYALEICRAQGMKLEARDVTPLKMEEMKAFVARRPVYTVLGTDRLTEIMGRRPRPWREAVAEYIQENYSKS